MKAILLVSHGSRAPETEKEIRDLIGQLKKVSKLPILEYAFLEITAPSIPEGIDTCIQKGAKEISVLLNFLNTGKHVNEDIPRIVDQAKKMYPNICFKITKPIGQHPGISGLFLDIIENV